MRWEGANGLGDVGLTRQRKVGRLIRELEPSDKRVQVTKMGRDRQWDRVEWLQYSRGVDEHSANSGRLVATVKLMTTRNAAVGRHGFVEALCDGSE